MNTPSEAFQGAEGSTYPIDQFPRSNYLFDQTRFDSEGKWVFCVFEGDEFPVARFGFQKGGFNITETDSVSDKSLLQLHLELVTDEGALLWVPTGEFSVDDLAIEGDNLSIELTSEGRGILSIQGWPESRWHFRSADGYLEMDLQFTVPGVTVLPDCVLPFSVFAMWEVVAGVSGTVRYGDRSSEVSGKAFHDHPRVVSTRSPVEIRNSYLYTAISFEDGSAWYSYHAQDRGGDFISYYCFGDYIDAEGFHDFSKDTQLIDIQFDENSLPTSWKISWVGEKSRIMLDVAARPFSILKSWGKAAPKKAEEFWIYPFVLDCTAEVESRGETKTIHGRGLPEYVNLECLSL